MSQQENPQLQRLGSMSAAQPGISLSGQPALGQLTQMHSSQQFVVPSQEATAAATAAVAAAQDLSGGKSTCLCRKPGRPAGSKNKKTLMKEAAGPFANFPNIPLSPEMAISVAAAAAGLDPVQFRAGLQALQAIQQVTEQASQRSHVSPVEAPQHVVQQEQEPAVPGYTLAQILQPVHVLGLDQTKGKPRYCAACRIHGIETPLKENFTHKKVCPFLNCPCDDCSKKRKITEQQKAHQQATKRQRTEDTTSSRVHASQEGGQPAVDMPQAAMSGAQAASPRLPSSPLHIPEQAQHHISENQQHHRQQQDHHLAPQEQHLDRKSVV